jgi:hypothetical protein
MPNSQRHPLAAFVALIGSLHTARPKGTETERVTYVIAANCKIVAGKTVDNEAIRRV